MATKTFLKAQWINLVMINYEVDPFILQPHLPPGTVLDTWEGKTLVSMVGFMFKDTSVLGIKWPFHITFEEVNLRFYVRYFDGKEWKRGAVFISEIVPKHMIAIIANTLYNEHYSAMPMKHEVYAVDEQHTNYNYQWKYKGRWNQLGAIVDNARSPIQPGSAEEFIFEHYWGYNKLTETTTIEYQVEHPSWNIGRVTDFVFDADIACLYGEAFVPYLTKPPISAYFADGSEIGVRMGAKIKI
ncbi:YqjF family protein [Mucilaginibacter myungsuensis]|uniref:DUF2071 domain-containing protein n=1 Tax=Mucilaginibacter myungsuensis TaxID=649104 RepID=A0A929PYA5_9SPHI|nr:DUF2071 domain-containing protein [Mucilaginibacter myungsuensis]MBE9663245.1 DUF2071 domain-containing protein [Mucilaginibacter myungsuensis]MDN3598878.1 DUF2071 domain-containing protein [Mucilaginibacter myungsuensis]